MIYDCFSYWDEDLLLDLRLKILNTDMKTKAECIDFGLFNFSKQSIEKGESKLLNYEFKLSPKLEGTMLFFPATLRHCVHPFYETDEARISIAGNLSYLPA